MEADSGKIFLEDEPGQIPSAKKVISIKELGKEYRLTNTSECMVLKTHVDGDLYTDADGKKCDYMLSSKVFETAILIELKGSDVEKAAEQLLSTYAELKVKYGYSRYYGRIIPSKVPAPDLKKNGYKRLSGLLKMAGGNLKVKEKKLEESLNSDFSLS